MSDKKYILTYARLISGNYIFNKDVFELFEKWKYANRIQCITAKVIGGGSGHIVFSTNPTLSPEDGDAWSTISLNGIDSSGQIKTLEEFAHQIPGVKQLRIQPKSIHDEINLYLQRLAPKRPNKVKSNTFILATVSLSNDKRELTIKFQADSCIRTSTQYGFFMSSKIRSIVTFYATSRQHDVTVNPRLLKRSHIRPENVVRIRKKDKEPQLDLLELKTAPANTIPPELVAALQLVKGQQILDAIKSEGISDELSSLIERWMIINKIF